MADRYQLGVAGLVHDHVWAELAKWKETGQVDIVAAADPNAPLQERIANEFGVQQLFSSVTEMLENSEVDILQVCTSNAGALEVIEAAAERKIPVVLEKPMAATLEQADRMLSAMEEAGVLFFVNWPNRWRPPTLRAWEQIQQGVIGEVFQARVRMAHRGPREFGCSDYFCDWLYDASQNGGGALIDYCCYGAAAFRYLFGMPQAVQAVAGRLAKEDINVEDNAAITLLYEKRFAIAEASWSQIPSYHDAVYLGSKGTLWTDAGKMWVAYEEGEQRELPVEPLPEGHRTGPESFLACLKSGESPGDVCSPQICRDVQEILQSGLQAAQTGQRIQLSS